MAKFSLALVFLTAMPLSFAFADEIDGPPRLSLSPVSFRDIDIDPLSVIDRESGSDDFASERPFLALTGAQEFSEERAESLGTGASLSIKAGIAYPRHDFTVKSTVDDYHISTSLVAAAAISLDFRIFRDLSLYLIAEQDSGTSIRNTIVSAGIGYNLYYPISNLFEPAEQKAAVVAGFSHGSLDITRSGFPGDFDDTVGYFVAIDYSGMIETHWEFNWTIGFRYLVYDYNPDATVYSSPDTVGGGGGYTMLGIGYRF